MKLNKEKIIALDKFIYNALYDLKNGYYIKKNPFGKSGDFITSSHISVLFSEIIAVWIISFWEYLKSPKKINVIELGAGNGEMMFEIIKTSKKFEIFEKSCNFYIYEKSPKLIKVQKKRLKNFKVIWLNDLNKIKNAPSIFLGNEFLDSFPIKQLVKKKNIWFEKYIDLSKKNIRFIDIKININKYKKILGKKIFKTESFIEFSPSAIKILKVISNQINLKNGGLLIIDYGYLKSKMFNSLQGIKKHKSNNILNNVGNSDITYLINFQLVKKIIEKFNLKLNGLTTQGNFLTKMGIIERADIISKNLTFFQKTNVFFRLKRLIDKNQMGELFKVMFVSNKNITFKNGFTK